MRARLSERIRLVSGFLRELCDAIGLESNTDAGPVLREMRRMPELLNPRRKLTPAVGREARRYKAAPRDVVAALGRVIRYIREAGR